MLPDIAFCSTAKRARETCAAVIKAFPDMPVSYRDDLYHASADLLYETVKRAPDGADRLLVVGHNPGLHDFCLFLLGGGQADLVTEMRRGFRTGSLAVFSCAVDVWKDLMPGANNLARFLAGRDL
jgi:phosphohistidine phosphatase